jgi:hypothetical protein
VAFLAVNFFLFRKSMLKPLFAATVYRHSGRLNSFQNYFVKSGVLPSTMSMGGRYALSPDGTVGLGSTAIFPFLYIGQPHALISLKLLN